MSVENLLKSSDSSMVDEPKTAGVADAAPAGDWIERPDSLEVPIDPEAVFANHVEYVRTNGDVLDAAGVSNRKLLPGDKRAVRAIALGVGAAAFAGVAPIIGVATFGAANFKRYRSYNPKKHNFNDIKNLYGNLPMSGHRYELYRVQNEQTKQPEVVMRWYSPDPEQHVTDGTSQPTRAASMAEMAALAYKHDVKAVLVETQELTDDSTLADEYATAKIDLQDWLNNHKHLGMSVPRIKGDARRKLYAFTPEDLSTLAYKIDRKLEDAPALETLIDYIRQHRPEHPLVRRFDENQVATAGDQSSLVGAAGRCLQQRLDTAVGELDRSNPEQPTRRKQYLQPQLKGKDVRWDKNWQPYETTPLLRSLDISEGDMRFMQEHMADLNPKDQILAAEYAIYIQNFEELSPTSAVDPDERVVKIIPNIQTCILDAASSGDSMYIEPIGDNPKSTPVILPNRQLTRRLAGMTVLTLALPVIGFQSAEMETKYQAPITTAEQEYADTHHIIGDDIGIINKIKARQNISTKHTIRDSIFHAEQPIEVPLEYAEAYAEAAAKSAVTVVEDVVAGKKLHWQLHMSSTTNSGSDATGSQSSSSVLNPSAGNVQEGSGEHVPIWNIQSNGMESFGYWAQEVDTVYDGKTWHDFHYSKDDDGDKEYDELSQHEINSAYRLPVRLATTRPHLEVTRSLHGNDINMAYGDHKQYYYIDIPVLAGTVPEAANVVDKPVKLIKKTDGTYAMLLPDEEVGAFSTLGLLTYDLTDGTPVPPHATMSNYIHDKKDGAPSANDTKMTDDTKARRAVRKAWNTEAPELAQVKKNRAEAEAEYLHEHFTYSLAPLTEVDNTKLGKGGMTSAGLVTASFKTHKAVCNTAETIVAIDNRKLNPASGYNNDGDNKLVAAEAHMWLVDSKGQILDATPTQQELDDAASHQTHGDEDLLGLAGIGLAGGIAVAATRRARRRRTAQQVEDLDILTSDQLQEARNVADMAAYSYGFDATKLAPTDPTIPAPQAMQKLRAPGLHTSYATSRLDEAIRAAGDDPVATEKLTTAKQVLKTIKHSGGISYQPNTDGLNGVL